VIQSAKNLKVISRCGTGMDSVDQTAAKNHGVTVLNTPEAPAQAVAELTMGLMLASLRQINQTDRLIRNGEWPRTQGGLLAATRCRMCCSATDFSPFGRKKTQIGLAWNGRLQ
jgi:D-3-phosphoglycerate dehydrogenase